MYTKFYGLAEKPFEINPDPKFLYLGENHKEALAHLTYAVQGKKAFTVITGDVGTGKTTLINSLLGSLDGGTRTAFLFNPKLKPADFLHLICEDLGLKPHAGSKGEYLTQLYNFLLSCHSRNENVVLIIDEAQVLSPELLEEVRLLTNLETPRSKLLQVILIGQPELNEVLNRREFKPLKQRVVLRYHLHVLKKGETIEYIFKRLQVAGSSSLHIFTADALSKIHKFSGGIPRLINIICDNALLRGYANGNRVIGGQLIQEAVQSLESPGAPGKRKSFSRRLVIIFAVILLGALSYWLIDEFFPAKEFDLKKWVQTLVDVPRELIRKSFQ
jgi:general secretion pathway protein A